MAVYGAGSEGEPLAAGHFSKSFVVVPAGESYSACAYLDTTASANPDVFEYGCYETQADVVHFPEVPSTINCYMSNLPWWVVVSAGQVSEKLLEARQAENKQRAEAEQAQRREVEESEASGLHPTVAMQLCHVPDLRRHTAAGARWLLREAGCRPGRVRKLRGHGKPVVESRSPKRGRTLPRGSAVAIVLAAPRH